MKVNTNDKYVAITLNTIHNWHCMSTHASQNYCIPKMHYNLVTFQNMHYTWITFQNMHYTWITFQTWIILCLHSKDTLYFDYYIPYMHYTLRFHADWQIYNHEIAGDTNSHLLPSTMIIQTIVLKVKTKQTTSQNLFINIFTYMLELRDVFSQS